MAVDDRLKNLRGSSRRDFLRWSAAVAAALGLERSRYLNVLGEHGGEALADVAAGLKRQKWFHFNGGTGGLAWAQTLWPVPGVATSTNAAYAFHELGKAVKVAGTTKDLYYASQSPYQKLSAAKQVTCMVGGQNRAHTNTPPLLAGAATSLFAGSRDEARYVGFDNYWQILTARGVPTPGFCMVEHLEDLTRVELPFPLIVKPSREDASTGIDFDSVVTDRRGLGKAVTKVLRTFHQPALVEQYIDGREVYVPLLGNGPRRSLPLTEIRFGGETFATRPRVLSYRAKWHLESPECEDSPSHPALLTPELEARCVEVAMGAFEALECRDYGRVDLRVDAAGNPFVIDINPNCDLHPQAGFARAAEAAGISYGALALHLVDLAWERRHGNQAPRGSRPTAARRAAGPHRDLLAGRSGLRARAHRRGSPAGQP